MPLFDTDARIPTLTGANARTLNEKNQTVVVEASSEAISDYGWSIIIYVASAKYDNGNIASNGPPPLVRVTTSDCADA